MLATVAAGVDEFALAGLEPEPSLRVKPPWVKGAPAALECRLWRVVELPPSGPERGDAHRLVIGEVIGIHVVDGYIREGRVDTGAMRALSRLGYMDYAVLEAATIFTMNRPEVGADGRSATVSDAPWDGVYR